MLEVFSPYLQFGIDLKMAIVSAWYGISTRNLSRDMSTQDPDTDVVNTLETEAAGTCLKGFPAFTLEFGGRLGCVDLEADDDDAVAVPNGSRAGSCGW